MSFLNDILATVNELNYLNISKIEEKVFQLKDEMKEYMEDKFINYNQRSEYSKLLVEVDTLDTEISSLVVSVKNEVKVEMSNSTSELQSLTNNLKEATFSLEISKNMLAIDKCLSEISNNLRDQKYLEAATALKEAQDLLEQLGELSHFLDIYEAIKFKVMLYTDSFHDELRKVLHSNIHMSESTMHTLKTVHIQMDTNNMDCLQSLFTAFLMFDSSYVQTLGQFLLKHVLTPIIMQQVTLNRSDNNGTQILQLIVDSNEKKRSHYSEVFKKIHDVFDFIAHVNFLIDDEGVLNKVGEIIKQSFCDILIKECLVHTIPASTQELQDEKVTAAIENLQMHLTQLSFFNETDTAIMDYAYNFDVLFANKMCQSILHKAREIMKKDLHDMAEIGSKEQEETEHTNAQTRVDISDMFDSSSPLAFPKCMVSVNMKELTTLILSVLTRADESSEMSRDRLICTAVNIVRLYQDIVPIQHELVLKTIPQQAALFHNNCMYFAHWLVTTGYLAKRSKISAQNNMVFVDQVQPLRSLGTCHFVRQMHTQKMMLSEIIRKSDLPNLSQLSHLQTTGQAIQQCLLQLELLRSVWINVLPNNVYCKAIGCLLNSFIDELIQRVCGVEDIPAKITEQLVEYFRSVTDRMELVFKESSDIFKHVKHWQKLKELIIVLGSSLVQIRDRWSDGKGPLAIVFKPEDVKKLIRALFQNTDQRAELLLKVR